MKDLPTYNEFLFESKSEKDANSLFNKFLKDIEVKDYPTAKEIAHDIKMDDGKISAAYIKTVMKKHKNIDLK